MEDGHHLEIVKSPYVSKKTWDFDEMWCTTAYLELDDSHMTKYKFFKNFKMADSRHTENVFGHKSAASCPISVKFCIRKNFGNVTDIRVTQNI